MWQSSGILFFVLFFFIIWSFNNICLALDHGSASPFSLSLYDEHIQKSIINTTHLSGNMSQPKCSTAPAVVPTYVFIHAPSYVFLKTFG